MQTAYLEFQFKIFRSKRALLRSLFLFCGLLTAGGPLFAHHGSAAYMTGSVVVLRNATVTKFVWANPHIMLMFDVKDRQGKVTHWAGEAGSPSAVRALGWTKNSLRPRDEVTVRLYPSKFDSNVGRLDTIVLADGAVLRNEPRGDRGSISRY